MSRRWVTTKIWFIWFQNESGMWSSYFIQISFFFQLSQPNSSSFYPDLDFFQLSQANSSSSYLDLGSFKLSRCFSLTSWHLYSFFFRWIKWVQDGSQPRFDLFGLKMKVVFEVHILSRFHFFFHLSQPNSSSFYPDFDFFQLSQANNSSSSYIFT